MYLEKRLKFIHIKHSAAVNNEETNDASLFECKTGVELKFSDLLFTD